MKEMDGQVVPCALLRVANWISGSISKRESIAGGSLRERVGGETKVGVEAGIAKTNRSGAVTVRMVSGSARAQ